MKKNLLILLFSIYGLNSLNAVAATNIIDIQNTKLRNWNAILNAREQSRNLTRPNFHINDGRTSVSVSSSGTGTSSGTNATNGTNTTTTPRPTTVYTGTSGINGSSTGNTGTTSTSTNTTTGTTNPTTLNPNIQNINTVAQRYTGVINPSTGRIYTNAELERIATNTAALSFGVLDSTQGIRSETAITKNIYAALEMNQNTLVNNIVQDAITSANTNLPNNESAYFESLRQQTDGLVFNQNVVDNMYALYTQKTLADARNNNQQTATFLHRDAYLNYLLLDRSLMILNTWDVKCNVGAPTVVAYSECMGTIAGGYASLQQQMESTNRLYPNIVVNL